MTQDRIATNPKILDGKEEITMGAHSHKAKPAAPSPHSKAAQSAARKAAQGQRGSNSCKGGSNVHSDGRGQSGQPKN